MKTTTAVARTDPLSVDGQELMADNRRANRYANDDTIFVCPPWILGATTTTEEDEERVPVLLLLLPL